jgi:hypothetical protein
LLTNSANQSTPFPTVTKLLQNNILDKRCAIHRLDRRKTRLDDQYWKNKTMAITYFCFANSTIKFHKVIHVTLARRPKI